MYLSKLLLLSLSLLLLWQSSWVKVSFSFEHIFQKFWYMGCKKCFRSTTAPHGVVFTCNSCRERHPAEPRSLVIQSTTFNRLFFSLAHFLILTFLVAHSSSCSCISFTYLLLIYTDIASTLI